MQEDHSSNEINTMKCSGICTTIKNSQKEKGNVAEMCTNYICIQIFMCMYCIHKEKKRLKELSFLFPSKHPFLNLQMLVYPNATISPRDWILFVNLLFHNIISTQTVLLIRKIISLFSPWYYRKSLTCLSSIWPSYRNTSIHIVPSLQHKKYMQTIIKTTSSS